MKKLLLTISMILMVIPINVFALDASVSLSCDKFVLSAGQTTTCSIKVSTSGEVSATHVEVSLGNDLTLVSASKDSIWNGDGEGGVYDLYTDINKSGNFNIGTFVVKVNDGVTTGISQITLKNIALADENFKDYSFSVTPHSIRIPSSVNTLKNITVEGAEIDFSSDKTSYEVETDKDRITIKAEATDATATVSGAGTKALEYGENKIVITVTSETGSKKEYTVTVTRKDNRSTNNYLKDLTLSEGKIKFKETTTTYNITVGEDVESIKIEATLDDEKASFVDSYGPRTVNLQYGNNKIQVRVQAENEKVRIYTINVTREGENTSEGAEKSDVNTLKEITLSKGLIEFDSDIEEYELELPYSVEELEIEAIATNSKAKIEGTGKVKLEEGLNEIEITVTAENGDVKVYTLKITRLEDTGEELDSNNYLSNLEIKGYEIKFDKKATTYQLTINGEKELDITAIPEKGSAKVTIQGNSDLEDGSVIKIKVMAENGDVRTYNLNIMQAKNNNMFILILILIIIAIIVAAAIIMNNKKKNNKPVKEEETTI